MKKFGYKGKKSGVGRFIRDAGSIGDCPAYLRTKPLLVPVVRKVGQGQTKRQERGVRLGSEDVDEMGDE
jgi:hypothetical protein